MNLESDARHVTALIPDYVLDLLAGEEQRLVSTHLALCHHCRLAVRRERQIVLAVRDTFSTATQPDSKRLRALRPRAPQSTLSIQPNWSKPLAATLLLLLVILGSLALQSRRNDGIWPAASPGVFAATVAVTDTPTLTATSTATENATASAALPTPEAAEVAAGAVLAPRPALVPVAVSPLLN